MQGERAKGVRRIQPRMANHAHAGAFRPQVLHELELLKGQDGQRSEPRRKSRAARRVFATVCLMVPGTRDANGRTRHL
jgi:hypothetical protein